MSYVEGQQHATTAASLSSIAPTSEQDCLGIARSEPCWPLSAASAWQQLICHQHQSI